MKVTVLVENQRQDKHLKSKHGLCLYLESGGQKILFDLGPDDTFIKNASKLGIDIETVAFGISSYWGNYRNEITVFHHIKNFSIDAVDFANLSQVYSGTLRICPSWFDK